LIEDEIGGVVPGVVNADEEKQKGDGGKPKKRGALVSLGSEGRCAPERRSRSPARRNALR
jgi:hypothetical protein